MLAAAAARDQIQTVVAQHGCRTVIEIAQLYAERVLQLGIRDLLAARYIIKADMADKRCITLLEAEHGDRSSVGGEAARDDIQLGRAEFEQLLALGGINGSGGAVALLVSDEQKIARPSDAAGQNGGIQRDLRLDRGRIRQNRILAAAVIDQNIGLAGLHDRIGIADRHLKRRHAARTGEIKRVAVCVGETGLEQRTIAEYIVFEFYVRDVALMLARTGERVLHRALNG